MHSMAILAREATTVRHVLESIFRYLDTGNLWSPTNGLALSVLLDLQRTMEKSGKLILFFPFLCYSSIFTINVNKILFKLKEIWFSLSCIFISFPCSRAKYAFLVIHTGQAS